MSEQDLLPDRDVPPHPFDDNGPPNYAADAVDELRRRLKEFEARRDAFVEKAKKVRSIRDRHDVGSAADLIGMARQVEKMVDEARKAIADPHAEAFRRVNAEANAFWTPVWDAMGELQRLADTWVNEEEARIRAQQREQQEAEATLRRERGLEPPPAPIAPKRRSFRGELGHQAVVTADDVIEIEDVRLLPDFIFQADVVKEAIIKVARPLVKQRVQIPGLKVTPGTKTSIRR